MPLTVLETKLFAPPLRQKFVRRPAVTSKLHIGMGHPLTLIAAPAGFGKTTLVTEWIEQTSIDVAWLSLDDDDNDLSHFLVYLIAALQTKAPRLGATAQNLLAAPETPLPKTLLTLLLNDLGSLSSPMALVLDDYHLISAPAIHDALTFLIDHLPPSFYLLITTRIDPPLPLARWRVRNQLTEVRADDLRFSQQDTTSFLNEIMGLTLTPDEVASLEERTEGWIAALQLAALSMQGRSDVTAFIQAFSGSHRHLLSYLVEEVLNRCSASTLDFLLRTSLLERLTPSLCNAMTGRTDSSQLLKQLEAANLFLIPLDDEGRWYRYHHLFAEVLQTRLVDLDGPSIQPLHQRASLWYEEQGLWSEAIHHALATHDFEHAATLIEQIGIALFAQTAMQHALDRWLSTVPIEVIHQRPRLCLIYAWLCIDRRDLMSAGHTLTVAEAALPSAPVELADVHIQGAIAAMRARLVIATTTMPPADALTWGEKALALLPDGQATFRCIAAMAVGHAYVKYGNLRSAEEAHSEADRMGHATTNVYLYVSAAANHSIVQRALGSLHLAQATCRQALAWVAQHSAHAYPIVGGLDLNLADLLREQNDLTTALHHAEIAVARTNQELNPAPLFILSHLVLIRIHQARDDWSALWPLMEKLSAKVEAYPSVINSQLLPAMQAQFWLAQALISHNHTLLTQAVTWAQATSWQEGPLLTANRLLDFIYLGEHTRIARAQILVVWARLTNDLLLLHEILVYLDRQWQIAESAGLRWLQIKVKALQALIYEALLDEEQSWQALTTALRLAQPNDYRRVFLDEGEEARHLLIAFRKWSANQPAVAQEPKLILFVETLLSNFPVSQAKDNEQLLFEQGNHQPDSHEEQPLFEPLSERELEVLPLLATGLSNADIASRLIISISTVKTHINHIFGKLSVANRTQATARARALGLLAD